MVRSVCLSVRRITKKVVNGFLRNVLPIIGGVGHGPRNDGFNFGDDPDHRPDPGVRSPKSEIRIHWIIVKVSNEF